MIGSRWAEQGKSEQAIGLNSKARWIYPLLFVIVVVIARLY